MTKRQLFWLCLLFFALHQLLQKGFGIHLPFLHAYFDPFLSMPILLGLLDWERAWRYGWRPLRPWELGIITALFSLLFEWGFPSWSDAFTADLWDVPAYAFGALCYGLSCCGTSTAESP
ncbi:MAG TPA: hypothetical protein VJ933_12260 [Phaeodactylibacter sp.]|nr:hypothetical protein [Phaeodactylibacter sp.]